MQLNRTMIIGIIWFFFGAFVCGAGIFYLFNKNPTLVTNYLTKQKTGQSVSPDTLIVDLNQVNKDLAVEKFKVVLPKSKVSIAYYDTFNRIFNEMIIVDSTYRNDLAPLIVLAKTNLDKKNYQELVNIGVKIKDVNEIQKKRLVILTGYFNTLATINSTIKDSETNILTVDFITAGKNAVASYGTYSALIDKIISGNISSQTVSEAKTIKDDFSSSINSFHNASTKLGTFFNNTLVSDLKAAEASSTKKQ